MQLPKDGVSAYTSDDDLKGAGIESATMNDHPMYHAESRKLQDQFDTRRLADRLAEKLSRSAFTEEDRAFIEAQRMFFLASTDADGFPDCSYKGGDPGFVRVVDERTLIFPSYDGNGMFKSLGNICSNPAVGLLFMSFEQPKRLRVNGTATVSADDASMALFPGAQLLIRVTARHIFPNCPRYIPTMQMVEASPYVPREGCEAPVPKWKTWPQFNEVLPASDPARKNGA
jgi:predicted pyridoxine 5'-phosphate oxidase superfamily flavin-nucleotide-binding protein